MPRRWVDIPLSAKLTENVDKTMIGAQGLAKVENGFQTEFGSHSRFGKLEVFANLGDNGRVYMEDWRGDLIATTSTGRLYRVDYSGNVADETEVFIPGHGRHIFAKSEDEMAIAAGAEIVRFAGSKTELLGEGTPRSSHVGYIDGYFVALEINSGRFYHSEAGLGRVWDSLSLFAANGSPDNISALLVTPYRELLLCGKESIEQFERLSGGTLPFFRRWSIGEGISVPYALTFADNGAFTVNQKREIVRFGGQQSVSVGDQIGWSLEKIDNWRDAWMGGGDNNPLHFKGQKFLILQIPFATNEYGTKGITYLYDYRLARPYRLYGWNADLGVPDRWPGWSHWTLWDRNFVGGEGVVYELVDWT